jgi:hypothetical protein
MDEIIEKIAKGFNYDINDVREAIIFSQDKTIDSVIAYCEAKKKEKLNGKEEKADG